MYQGRTAPARVAQDFPTFTQFQAEATAGLDAGGVVWDRIERIEPAPHTGLVYDFSVAHSDHNFIANGFVVSNCGVRLLASEMEEGEVQPLLVRPGHGPVPAHPQRRGRGRVSQAVRRGDGRGAGDRGALGPEARAWPAVTIWPTPRRRARCRAPGRTKSASGRKQRGRDATGHAGRGQPFRRDRCGGGDIRRAIWPQPLASSPARWCCRSIAARRGLGHQVCTDYVQQIPADRSKNTASSCPTASWSARPIESPEGQDYLAAMAAAANYAWANRQVLAHQARQAFDEVLAGKVRDWDLRHGLRHRPQHGQAGDARGGRPGLTGVRASQGGHARLWPRQPCPARPTYRDDRPAGAGAGQHGHGQLCVGRHGGLHAARPLAPPATAPAGR